MKQKTYPLWYKARGLKHITGFLTASDKKKLQALARAADKSLARYVTRLLERHILEEEQRAKGGKMHDSPQTLHRAQSTFSRGKN